MQEEQESLHKTEYVATPEQVLWNEKLLKTANDTVLAISQRAGSDISLYDVGIKMFKGQDVELPDDVRQNKLGSDTYRFYYPRPRLFQQASFEAQVTVSRPGGRIDNGLADNPFGFGVTFRDPDDLTRYRKIEADMHPIDPEFRMTTFRISAFSDKEVTVATINGVDASWDFEFAYNQEKGGLQVVPVTEKKVVPLKLDRVSDGTPNEKHNLVAKYDNLGDSGDVNIKTVLYYPKSKEPGKYWIGVFDNDYGNVVWHEDSPIFKKDKQVQQPKSRVEDGYLVVGEDENMRVPIETNLREYFPEDLPDLIRSQKKLE